MNPIRAIKMICLTVTWALLTMPDWKREKRWKNISASGLLTQDHCSRERLWHISLWNTRCDLVRCWAVIKCKNPFESANFANDKSGISIGASRTAAFPFRQVQRRERSDLSNTHLLPQRRSWRTCWPHSLKCLCLSSGQASRLMADTNISFPKETQAHRSTFCVCAWIRGELQYCNSVQHHPFTAGYGD